MMKEPSWLGHAAERVRSESWTLGRLLLRCCELEGTSDNEISTELGCSLDTLRWIYLCSVPSKARFADDVRRIAERFGLAPSRLAALVRRADAVCALTESHDDASHAALLLAARDREAGEDSQ